MLSTRNAKDYILDKFKMKASSPWQQLSSKLKVQIFDHFASVCESSIFILKNLKSNQYCSSILHIIEQQVFELFENVCSFYLAMDY